jgi:hypothetical protein
MNKNTINAFLAFGIFSLLIFVVYAVPFTPQGNIDLKSIYSLIGGVDINATTINADYINGTQLWAHDSYPASCPAGSALTTVGNTTTCEDNWVNSGTDDTMSGVLTINVTSGSNAIIIPEGYKICFDGATCSHYAYYNGTHPVFE